MWNDLDHNLQCAVLSKILELSDNSDREMQIAFKAAFLELRMWSKFPCEIIEDLIIEASEGY
jgi:hypothetical protein